MSSNRRPIVRFQRSLSGPIRKIVYKHPHGYVRVKRIRVGGSFVHQYYPIQELNDKLSIIQPSRCYKTATSSKTSKKTSKKQSGSGTSKKKDIANAVSKILRGGSIRTL